MAPIILNAVRHCEFSSVLDAFGGTGSVSYAFKQAGKAVTYNDVLAFNHQIGVALIENEGVVLDEADVDSIVQRQPSVTYPDFIEQTFEGIYFTTDENRWLDAGVANIRRMQDRFKQALAWFALFQSAMAKRPYNLFHRSNLYMRTAQVRRSFGNKKSWDRTFEEHFRGFAAEANRAIFRPMRPCRSVCRDVFSVEGRFDLVYIDPPYVNGAGTGVDYRGFYHFLEGLMDYDHWPTRLDWKSKHRRLISQPDPWCDPTANAGLFLRLFEHFHDSILVVSYRSDGSPSINELAAMLRRVKGRVTVLEGRRNQYALSTSRATREVLLLAADQ